MMPEDNSDRGDDEIRVTDRRRFTESGELRDGGEEESAPAAQPEEPGTPAARGRDAEAERALPPPSARDLGISQVFRIFWESALLSLGAQTPDGQSHPVDLEQARHAIDLLKVIEEKTRGNLTPDEESELQQLLHQAQLFYVRVAAPPGGGAG